MKLSAHAVIDSGSGNTISASGPARSAMYFIQLSPMLGPHKEGGMLSPTSRQTKIVSPSAKESPVVARLKERIESDQLKPDG